MGARAGLRSLADVLDDYAHTIDTRGDPLPHPVGPYDDFSIQHWARGGIDDQGVHGTAETLRDLARQIRDRLEGAAPGAVVTLGSEYGSDAEYTLSLEVRNDDFDPAGVPAHAQPGASDPAGLAVPASPPVPVRLHDADAGLTESDGLLHMTGDALELQYETKDAIFGLYKSGVEDVVLPFADIASVEFKRGPFRTELAIQVTDL